MTTGVLALLGSGETAPGMTKVHRQLLSRLSTVHAVNLDTAYGFQENVPQMTEKLVEYFATSLLTTLAPLHFTSFEQSSELERTIFKQQVRHANYVFAGPGSPSYALGQWQPLGLVDDLTQVLSNGGTLCFASAACATLGVFSAPIYEIYKVGAAPYWIPGLNLLAAVGLNCVVIPHFDNKEGGNHDTSRCYLGERRLRAMERQLPSGVATLGIDEHTALIFDLETSTLQVLGRSNAYWRVNDESRVLENGSRVTIADLDSLPPTPRAPVPIASEPATAHEPIELGKLVAAGGPDALEALAQLVQRATTGGEGFIDPAPLIEGVLAVRVSARAHAQFELADRLRDALIKAGIDVQDAPEGASWSLHTES